jgi:hypothetical protein
MNMYCDEFVQKQAQALEKQAQALLEKKQDRNSLVDKREDGITSLIFGERAEMVC